MAIELTTYPGLDPRIVILRAGDLVNAVFVRAQRFNLLFDTLDTPGACDTALGLLGPDLAARPLISVNSHMDWDHFWGNAAVAGRGPILAHAGAAERLRSSAAQETLRRKAAEDPRFAEVALVAPSVTFPDRLRLDGGDLTFELFPTPGHTPDHISIWIPELRVCLAADAVERPIPKVWSADPADLAALVASLETIRDLRAAHVVLAHGQTSDPAVVDANLAYFSALRARAAGGRPDLDAAELPEGWRLDDFIPGTSALAPEPRAFYERFHRANLRAAFAA